MRTRHISALTALQAASARPATRLAPHFPSVIAAGREPDRGGGVTLSVTLTERVTETGSETVSEIGVEPRGRAQELEIRSTCGCCRWVGVWGREFTPSGGQAAAPRARLTARPPRDSSTDSGEVQPLRGPVLADRTSRHHPCPRRCDAHRAEQTRTGPHLPCAGLRGLRGAPGRRTRRWGARGPHRPLQRPSLASRRSRREHT